MYRPVYERAIRFDVTYCYIRSRTFQFRVDIRLWEIRMIIIIIMYTVYYINIDLPVILLLSILQ